MELVEKKPKKPYLTSKPSDTTIDSQIRHDGINRNLQEKLLGANVLFVPKQGYVDAPDLVYFPVGTYDLYQFITSQSPEELKVEICSEEADYKELALHADWLIITEFIVKELAAPLFVALLAEYIIKKVGNKKDDTVVKSKFTLVEDKTNKSIELQYEGPAKEYRDIMLNAIAKISTGSRPTKTKIVTKRKRHSKKK